MNAVDTFIHYGNTQFGKDREVTPELFNNPDFKFMIDAMEAYGKQEYNQAIDDLIAGDVILDKAQTIAKFKKV